MLFAHVSIVFGGVTLFKHADVVLMFWHTNVLIKFKLLKLFKITLVSLEVEKTIRHLFGFPCFLESVILRGIVLGFLECIPIHLELFE